jgi:hypothetical protein
MKPFTKIASVLSGVMALVHAFRLISPFQIMIGNNEVPISGSFVAIIIGVALCVGLWRESKK